MKLIEMLIHYWYMHLVKKLILVAAKMHVSLYRQGCPGACPKFVLHGFRSGHPYSNPICNEIFSGGNGPSFFVQMFAQVAKWVVIIGLLYLLFDQVKKIGFNFFSNMEGKGLFHPSFTY